MYGNIFPNAMAVFWASIDSIFSCFFTQLFGGLKDTRGLAAIINQCHVISGDCSLPDLGISDDDRKLLAENVSIVYHCAATVRFDECLKRAVQLNTRGTKLMLELCKTFKKLDVSDDKVDLKQCQYCTPYPHNLLSHSYFAMCQRHTVIRMKDC